MVYTTNTGTNGSVVQGVQQPFGISVVNGIEEAKGITLKCSVYPNPTTDFLMLHVDSKTSLSIQSLSYQLFDVRGRLLENRKIDSNDIRIVMSHYAPSIYFVKVIQNNKKVKIFKIIKN